MPAPFARAKQDRFRESLVVELACADPDAVIHYSVDPKQPQAAWSTYVGPLVLRDSTTVRFVAEKDGRRSPAVESTFHRMPNDWSVDVRHAPNGQYTAGGPDGLIAPGQGTDGRANHRTGTGVPVMLADHRTGQATGDRAEGGAPVGVVGRPAAGRNC